MQNWPFHSSSSLPVLVLIASWLPVALPSGPSLRHFLSASATTAAVAAPLASDPKGDGGELYSVRLILHSATAADDDDEADHVFVGGEEEYRSH